METALVVGSVAWNTGLVTITGFLIKRWMDKQEAGIEQNKSDAKTAAKELSADLSASVAEYKEEIRNANQSVAISLREIHEQLRIANGRTAKIEGALDTRKAVCDERHAK